VTCGLVRRAEAAYEARLTLTDNCLMAMNPHNLADGLEAEIPARSTEASQALL
jgi:hypothetical protein